jgi:hypothetical protein
MLIDGLNKEALGVVRSVFATVLIGTRQGAAAGSE